MKSLIFAAVLMASAPGVKEQLTGRWEPKPSINGNITGVVFKPDNTYEAYINKKPFVSGRYTLQDSLISIIETACDKTGIYRLNFFSGSDSLRFVPVMDSCDQRREGMKKLVFGRVK